MIFYLCLNIDFYIDKNSKFFGNILYDSLGAYLAFYIILQLISSIFNDTKAIMSIQLCKN